MRIIHTPCLHNPALDRFDSEWETNDGSEVNDEMKGDESDEDNEDKPCLVEIVSPSNTTKKGLLREYFPN